MNRRQQLLDRDARNDADDLDPTSFLDSYIESNFPQTSAYPSEEQKANGVVATSDESQLDFRKKRNPGSGTSYDRPQVY
jgi:hypothetical protein